MGNNQSARRVDIAVELIDLGHRQGFRKAPGVFKGQGHHPATGGVDIAVGGVKFDQGAIAHKGFSQVKLGFNHPFALEIDIAVLRAPLDRRHPLRK